MVVPVSNLCALFFKLGIFRVHLNLAVPFAQLQSSTIKSLLMHSGTVRSKIA